MASLFNTLISLVSIALVIRLFGIEVQGLVAFGKLLSVGGFFSFFTLGLSAILTRKMKGTMNRGFNEESRQWLALISRWGFGLGVLVSLMLARGLYFAESEPFFFKK